ncbi:hypothetical protein BaRGS_00019514 [Batillaria attramentaria]|uniref:Uncharacterized protein n=1 Tax=Batillaria attramentaria TaxID=370345 RepID=A0ABD0KQ14_9CAEN
MFRSASKQGRACLTLPTKKAVYKSEKSSTTYGLSDFLFLSSIFLSSAFFKFNLAPRDFQSDWMLYLCLNHVGQDCRIGCPAKILLHHDTRPLTCLVTTDGRMHAGFHAVTVSELYRTYCHHKQLDLKLELRLTVLAASGFNPRGNHFTTSN